MKGLLVKDIQILLQQKRTLLLMVLIAVFMLFAKQDISFVVGYVTLIASFVALGTISYDELDNGYTFLFTLPVDRKGYVLSKYILSVSICVVVWAIINLLMAVMMSGEYHAVDFFGCVWILAVVLIMQFIGLPIQLKYGAEKSRIVHFLIMGGIVLLGFLLGEFGEYLPDMTGLVAWIGGLGIVGIVGLVVLVTALTAWISIVISCRVMKKKQF